MRLQSIIEARKNLPQARLDFDAVKIKRYDDGVRYSFEFPISGGAEMWVLAEVMGADDVLTISDLQVYNADDHPARFNTTAVWDAYEVGINVGTGDVRRVLRLVVDTVRADYPGIRRIRGDRTTGAHVDTGNTKIDAKIREGQHSGWSSDEETDEFDKSLLGPTGTFEVFHASAHRIETFKPFTHFGTKQAALQRARDKGLKNGLLYKASLVVTKSLWIGDSGTGNHTVDGILEALETDLRLPFADVSNASRSATKAARLLRRYGYDALVYRNGHEDRGSLSWVILDPTKIAVHTIKSL